MRQKAIQGALFVLTFITTTLAGAEWQFGRYLGLEEHPLTWEYFWRGMWFSVPFLGILTVHEFGHYFAAQRHRVRVTLPYYIPAVVRLFVCADHRNDGGVYQDQRRH